MEEKAKPKKSKFGRKKLPVEKKRTIEVRATYNQEEFEIIKEKLEAIGTKKKLAVFIRELSLSNLKTIKMLPAVNKETVIQIRRIGINMNQIAKQLNQVTGSIIMEEVNQKLGQIQDNLREVLRDTKGK